VLTPDQLREYVIRPAQPEDAPAVAACVDEAYRHYVARIGRPPGPMTEDYETVIRDFQVTVVESAGRIVAVLVLAEAGIAAEGSAGTCSRWRNPKRAARASIRSTSTRTKG